jgi:putative spermidine/putrescine transport system permease protein
MTAAEAALTLVPGSTKRAWRRRAVTLLLVLPLLVLHGGFFLLPVANVAWGSFSGLAFDFGSYRRVFADRIYLDVLLRTFEVSLYVTVACVVLGYPVAYLLSIARARTATVLSTLILIPLFTAFLIRTYAWMVILGRAGVINSALTWVGVVDAPIKLLNTTFAVVVGMAHVLMPIAVFTMLSVMLQIDRTVVRAAQVLGAHPVQSFSRVYFPMSLSGVAAAAVLVFIMSIGFYITPALLGGPADTMISQLIVVQTTALLNFELGYALAVSLLVCTLLVLAGAGLVLPLEAIWMAHGAADGGGPSRTVLARLSGVVLPALERVAIRIIDPLLSRRRRWLWAYAALMICFFLAPLAVIVVLSFSSSPFTVFPPPGFSLQWYEKFMHAKAWHDSLLFSIQVGLAAVAVALLAGATASFVLVRRQFPAKRTVFFLALAPIVIPVIILALALYVYEARLGILGTFPGLVIGHAVLATPYVIVVMSTAVRGFDQRLEWAAAVLGARPPQVLRRVTLPLLRPALLTAALLAFLVSFDELLISIFLLGRQTQTLPLKFWGDIKYQFDPLLSAASTLIVLVIAVVIVGGQLLRLRQARRRAGSIER